MKHGKLKSIQHANRRSILDDNKSVRFSKVEKGPRRLSGPFSDVNVTASEHRLTKQIEDDMYARALAGDIDINALMADGYYISSRRIGSLIYYTQRKIRHSSYRRGCDHPRLKRKAIKAIRRARDKYYHEQKLANERTRLFSE